MCTLECYYIVRGSCQKINKFRMRSDRVFIFEGFSVFRVFGDVEFGYAVALLDLMELFGWFYVFPCLYGA